MQMTTEALLERVEAVLPAIAERAPETEAQRRPHDDSIRELLAALVSTFVGGVNSGDMDSLEALMQQHQGQ